MKYGQTIKPRDVVGLIKEGLLYVGTKIEVQMLPSSKWTTARFVGFSTYLDAIEVGLENGYYARKDQARFPLPALKNGDPVIIGDVEHKRFFSHFNEDGINCYKDGLSAWTCKSTSAWGDDWRLPTKKELSDAGLDGWYDGRIELEEG